MSFSNPKEHGWTLLELTVVIVLIGILSVVGSNLIAPMIQGYLLNSVSEQALSAPSSAIWQIRRDYAMTKVNGATLTNCALTLNTLNGQVQYGWSQPNLSRNNSLLFSQVVASTCPFSLSVTGGKTLLNLVFTYAGTNGSAQIPVKIVLSSFE